ncbi:MAG TPA: hypothetical protein VER55_10610 [Ardenticatenaceae bacterium]|nr:hypothetical protein [Ardenticatenaceae bacterium]
MPVEELHAHPDVVADLGQVALRRGPIIYCLEQVDHGLPLHRIVLNDVAQLGPVADPDVPDGVTVLAGPALALDTADWDGALYRTEPPAAGPCTIRAIPYYAWDNRGPSAMRVWIGAGALSSLNSDRKET